jgi:serine/threonine-protein kinase HipA
MTSETATRHAATREGATRQAAATEAYVWTWLPGETRPVVAGRLAAAGDQLVFNYGRSYLERRNAVALYAPELPLRPGTLPLVAGLRMPGCIRDAAPEAWGRRVIANRELGVRGHEIEPSELDELTYLLESGSDRIGALDFQRSARDYVAREAKATSLADLLAGAQRVEQGLPPHPDLDLPLHSAIGGGRPKALIAAHGKKYIAKLPAHYDETNVVKAEYIAMRLAALAGIRTAGVTLEKAGHKDVLLVERFDREKTSDGWRRNAMLSGLTLLGLDQTLARYAAYEDLATVIRHRFTAPKATLRELFARMLFNVLCGNTDDHARNHAAFWNGRELTLTPAYDICPQARGAQARGGAQASQAMLITSDQRASRITVCLAAAPSFLLSAAEAMAMAAHQIMVLRDHWAPICTQAKLSTTERDHLWRRQFLNPFAFEGAPPALAGLLG